MAVVITPPDFNFAAEFYPQIRHALLQHKRQFLPDLSEEHDLDPVMQFIDMLALVGHLSNSRLDFVAREMFLPTARRRASVDAQLRIIDEKLDAAKPAIVDVIAKHTRIFSATEPDLIPARSRFSTVGRGQTPAVHFESGATQPTLRTDQLSSVLLWDGAAFSAWTAGDDGPDAAGEYLLFSHRDAMWLSMDLALSIAAANITAVWEVSGYADAFPTSVAYAAPNLTFNVNSLLGATDMSGASVTVLCVLTGQSATFVSSFGANNEVVATTTFGQGASPSTDADDYIVSIDFVPIAATGSNSALNSTTDADIAWGPVAQVHGPSGGWSKSVVNSIEAFHLRWRVISVAGPTPPRLAAAPDTSDAEWWSIVQCTQGETISQNFGISDGTQQQVFPLSRSPYIEGSLTALTIGADPNWVVTEEASFFFSADPAEKIALLEVLPDGTLQIRFGNGTNGSIPPTGDAIVGSYRIGADSDGNVGAQTITRNTSGVRFLTDIRNPRAAAGWKAPEGSTKADLEIMKRQKPAQFRTRGRAINVGDVAVLAANEFVTALGASPVARAWAVEGPGIKDISLYVVGAGASLLSAATLTELNDFFNGAGGDPNDPARRLVANQTVVSDNHVLNTVAGALTVYRSGTTPTIAQIDALVQDILTDFIHPLAVQADGTFEWQPGGAFDGRVTPTRIGGQVFADLRPSVSGLRDVEVTDIAGGGAVPLVLGDNELPIKGAWVVNVVAV